MKRRVLLGALAVVFASTIFVGCSANDDSLKTDADKFSYVVGLNLGTNFKQQNIAVNPQLILKGLQDATSGTKPLLTPEQQQAIMTEYQKKIMTQMQEQAKTDATANLAAGQKFLADNGKVKGVVTLPSGLQYTIVKEGKGAKPKATSTVEVNYEGKLLSGKVFDSSYQRGKPVTFPLNQVIPGWTEALQHMPVGSTWMLYIPAQLGYGAQGMPGVIPPNSTLIFKVELLAIKK